MLIFLSFMQGDVHPDCDTGMMNCSRCGCGADSHEIDEVGNERERGNDAVALEHYDTAIIHYSRAIEFNSVDWRLWSNRSKCYSAKHWYPQALSDAERACLLNPNSYKVWYRQSIALRGLSKYKEALISVEKSLDCLKKEENPKPGDVKAIENIQRDLHLLLKKSGRQEHLGLQRSNKSRKSETYPLDKNLMSTNESIPSCFDRNDAISASVLKLESSFKTALEGHQAMLQKQYKEITSRLDKIESLVDKLVHSCDFEDSENSMSRHDSINDGMQCHEEVQSLSDEDSLLESSSDLHSESHNSSISRSSSSSSFSEAIKSIESAWEAKIWSSVKESGEESRTLNETTGDATVSKQRVSPDADQTKRTDSNNSRKFSRDYQERMARIKNAEERISLAGEEPLSTTDIDSLTQQKRAMCTNCEDECPGFKIYYKSTDVHDPEIMFYCSLCGCKSEDHMVDSVWQRQETLRKQREEQEAKMRADRLKSRHTRISESAVRKQEALTFMGLPMGSSKDQIKAAYKSLAKRYHPDKQKDKSNKEDIIRMQQLFTKATDAYKLLMQE